MVAKTATIRRHSASEVKYTAKGAQQCLLGCESERRPSEVTTAAHNNHDLQLVPAAHCR